MDKEHTFIQMGKGTMECWNPVIVQEKDNFCMLMEQFIREIGNKI